MQGGTHDAVALPHACVDWQVMLLLAERRLSIVREVEELRREQREAQAREVRGPLSPLAAWCAILVVAGSSRWLQLQWLGLVILAWAPDIKALLS